jgi:hypothetical protein
MWNTLEPFHHAFIKFWDFNNNHISDYNFHIITSKLHCYQNIKFTTKPKLHKKKLNKSWPWDEGFLSLAVSYKNFCELASMIGSFGQLCATLM